MKNKTLRTKKAVSPIIGYILLVVIAMTMSAIAYSYMKTFVPKDQIECLDGTSLFIQEYSYEGPFLEITFRNNGRFSVAGYYIKATTSSEEEIATEDLSKYFTSGGKKVDDIILFNASEENSLSPGETKISKYSVPEIYKIEITPVRYELVNGNSALASCTKAVIRENLS